MGRNLLVLIVVVLAAACGGASQANGPSDPGVACTLEARAGIVLTAFDSVSGQALTMTGTAAVQDGNYTEKALSIPGTPTRYSMAYERPGSYTVTLALDGYQLWRAAGVVVQRDVCHVVTVQLSARLVR